MGKKMIQLLNVCSIAPMLRVIVLLLLSGTPWFCHAQSPESSLPAVFEYQQKGKKVEVDSGKLFAFEQAVRQQFTANDPPDDIYLLAWSSAAEFLLFQPETVEQPRGMLLIEIRNGRGILHSIADSGEKQSPRVLSAAELKLFRNSIKSKKLDNLPRLDGPRVVRGKLRHIVGGTIYVYMHLTQQSGSRVWMDNPPTKGENEYAPDDPHWEYAGLVESFSILDTKAEGD